MNNYDAYFLVDKEYERQQEEAEQREEWEAERVRDILSQELDCEVSDDIRDFVNDRISSFSEEQWEILNALLVKLALGETASQKDSYKLLDHSDLCEVVSKNLG